MLLPPTNTGSTPTATGKFAGKSGATPKRKKVKFSPTSAKPLRSAIKKNIADTLSKIDDGVSMRVSSKSINILSELSNDLVTDVAQEANSLALKAGKQTISANEIISAVSLMLTPGSLRDHVVVQLRNQVADEKSIRGAGKKA
ncbi:Histone H2B.2 [Cucumispora dikerogammari]|nr:Histone H2B.2 [Cucumispora dikerogammari]